jgi:GH24 family phage-related lysozyme (muramidase)
MMKSFLLLPLLGILAMAKVPQTESTILPKNRESALSVDQSLPLNISQKGVDLIIRFEVSSKDYYNRNLRRPTVPAWQTTVSGITIGIGYDTKYNTKAQIAKDWGGVLSPTQISALQSVSHLSGKSAHYNGLPKVRNLISIDYEDAEKVFKKTTLPKFAQQTATAFQLTKDRLHPHSNGALTSLVYNRGPSMSTAESRNEMRWIRSNISSGDDHKVPSNIRSMKRLWSPTALRGLHLRRDAEAALFQEGLDARR